MPLQRARTRTGAWAVIALVLALASGCSSGEVVTQEGDGGNLQKLHDAYLEATLRLGHPPRNAAEIRPFLAARGDVESLLRSPIDGEPYVILWGGNPREMGGPAGTVIAYEQQGKDGTRYVFTSMGVMLMSEEDFARAHFSGGRRPK